MKKNHPIIPYCKSHKYPRTISIKKKKKKKERCLTPRNNDRLKVRRRYSKWVQV